MGSQLMREDPPAAFAKPMATYEVRGSGGVRLQAREWGDPDGPELLFIHGWSQSDLCWAKQVNGDLASRFRMITFDLRGHGMSEKPLEAHHYADPQLWAGDLAAVLDRCELRRPVVVAWSYGGFVLIDYVRACGEERLAAINLAGAAVKLSPPTFDHIGPGFLANAGDASESDLGTSIAAIRRFLRACTFEELDERDWTEALCWNMVVPPAVRGALISREIDGSDVLEKMTVPMLVTHGREDLIVSPSMAEHSLGACKHARASWYERVGHMPFWEAAERFDAELADLADGGR